MTRTIRRWACLQIGMRKTVAVESLGRAGRALDCAEVKAMCRKWLRAIYVGVGRPSPLGACNSARLFSNTPCDVARVAHPRQGKSNRQNHFLFAYDFFRKPASTPDRVWGRLFGITL